ncbi:MAG: SAM-dependent methyltransferase [Bacteroidales bacterium]|nr:SAM-dependent methyltransferase [Bacteroidales bacterium]
MRIYDAEITSCVLDFLQKHIVSSISYMEANCLFMKICGINNFLESDDDLQNIVAEINANFACYVAESNAEYGDFQTNQALANQIIIKIKDDNILPEILIEPTCGKGNFIIAALNVFDNIKKIYGIEIQKKYVWQTKFNILDFFLENPNKQKPEISIIHSSIFDFDLNSIQKQIEHNNLLIIGNPPWVTNSELSTLDSKNLPHKFNFKHHKGLDAMTGKGNFDIAEYITVDLLNHFGKCDGNMAFLVKNTVIKNIVHDQQKMNLPIADLKKLNIDSKKEFNVSVDASLFMCQLNSNSEYVCQESDFYKPEKSIFWGWKDRKFFSKIPTVDTAFDIDGYCQFEWRQGVKHDCSKVMELERKDDFFVNKLNETFYIEENLVFPILKSSDLKTEHPELIRKYVIITQKYVGQNTAYITNYPHTFKYLSSHIDFFRKRKSSIYKGKCEYSIFGVGDYSFMPYKVAISGLYKSYHFSLIKPYHGKPVMLDDTCYFIGFDNIEQAEIIWKLLNTDIVSNFLKQISFSDSKRMITKEVLMRIDFNKLVQAIKLHNYKYETLKLGNQDFINALKPNNSQMNLF